MTKEELMNLKVGDRVVASDKHAQPGMLWHPVPDRPKLGATYIVTGFNRTPPYQDISVKGLPGEWMRERFELKK